MASVSGDSLSSGGAAFSDPLAGVPQEARTLLWRGMLQATEQSVWCWEQTPPDTRHALPPHMLEHWGERFDETVLAQQPLKVMRRVWRIEHALAADVLEVLLLDEDHSADYLPLLTACYTRIGQIYSEIKRRCGLLFALLTLRWELKLLGYRGSLVVAPLLFEEGGR